MLGFDEIFGVCWQNGPFSGAKCYLVSQRSLIISHSSKAADWWAREWDISLLLSAITKIMVFSVQGGPYRQMARVLRGICDGQPGQPPPFFARIPPLWSWWYLALGMLVERWKLSESHEKQYPKTQNFQWNTSCPWTPKPWKMKVLNPQYMGYNP